MKKNSTEDIKYLESQLSQKIKIYKEFQKLDNKERYFGNLYHNAMGKMAEKKSEKAFRFLPAVGYAVLFIISFVVLLNSLNFNDKVLLSDDLYPFSETSLWLEEEEYLSATLDDEDFNIDYVGYINNDELNYFNALSFDYEIEQLPESDINDIYVNLKNKKIL